MALVEFPIHHKQARRRAPKVKTGCKTCKVRRVKCDEAKPGCLRYSRTGRRCDGYSPIGTEFQVQVWTYSQVPKLCSTMTAFAGFGDNVRYLEFYHLCARLALSSHFDEEFWSRIALQMAHSEPAVRHALIALGFLCQNEPGSMKHARAGFIADSNTKFVLIQYNRSVRSLVERMAEATYSPEIGLVTCLLFVCIEFLWGNYHTAFTHMKNGLSIISERRAKLQIDSQPLPTGNMTTNAVSEAMSQDSLDDAPHAFTLKDFQRRASDSTTIIENRLVPIFIRGIASALMYGVNTEENLDVPSPVPSLLQLQSFSCLQDTQEACYELRNASILHVRTMGRKFLLRQPVTTEDHERKDSLVQGHYAWLRTLELFEQHHTLPEEERVAISALKVSHYTTLIYISCSNEVREVAFDDCMQEFKNILRHSEIVMNSQTRSTPHGPNFTFEISIIPPLYFVATHCRCPITRRKAVALLARNPPREGLWDSQQHVIVSNRAIEMEEAELDPVTGWPVESARMWSCVINADMDRNGGFWVSFLPGRLVGEQSPDGRQKLILEFFHV